VSGELVLGFGCGGDGKISPTFEATRNGEFTRKPLKNELFVKFVKHNFGCPATSLLMILIKGLFLRIPEVP
jgi:hypothetical protein